MTDMPSRSAPLTATPPPGPGTTGAERAWAALSRQLADMLAHPQSPFASEAQRAWTRHILAHLIRTVEVDLAALIPGTGLPADTALAALVQDGMVSGDSLAPAILTRIEEYRWRSMMAGRSGASVPVAASPTPAEPDAGHGVDQSAVEAAYLALTIADRDRFDAHGYPLLPPADLDPDARTALLDEVAAALLDALGGDARWAAALEEGCRQLDQHYAGDGGIDAAAADYVAAVRAAADVRPALLSALRRHDWVAAGALLAHGVTGRGMAGVARALAVQDPALLTDMAASGVLTPDDLAEIAVALCLPAAPPVRPAPPPGSRIAGVWHRRQATAQRRGAML